MPNFNGLWTSRQQMQARGGNTWPSVPGAPTSPVATAGNASASVAFVAPADTGFPANAITGYRVTSTPGGFTGTGLTSPVTVSGLTNGTAYTFTVAAQNVNGYGPESVSSNSVTPVLPNYVEEVFSTWLYTGTGAAQTITNGVDLSTKGGLVWIKDRTIAENHNLFDTVRGAGYTLITNETGAQGPFDGQRLSAFTTSGFSVGTRNAVNLNTDRFSSWTFREQPKFFDIVTYTGTGSPTTIAHNLGSAPGCIIVKRVDSSGSWAVWHRSGTQTTGQFCAFLNSTGAYVNQASNFWGSETTPPDMNASTFGVGTAGDTNSNGFTYIAYIFAHNAGGFGLTGSDNVISCGSYVGNGSTTGPVVTLGYEPQWVLVKRATDGIEDWEIYDNMRGIVPAGADQILYPNNDIAEQSATRIQISATGFSPDGTAGSINTSGKTYIYIAIRRGPMAVPTTGTSVFTPAIRTGDGTTSVNVTNATFPVDLAIGRGRNTSAATPVWIDRLRGATVQLRSDNTDAQAASTIMSSLASQTGWIGSTGGSGSWNTSSVNYIQWYMRRAPSFFDEVCFTTDGSGNFTGNHNLGVTPELIITKIRSGAGQWWTYSAYSGTSPLQRWLLLNDVNGASGTGTAWWATSATSFSVLNGLLAASATNVAYLFATCAGVSKVGSYTGTGATQTVACGFAAGARFVLIKRADTDGDWYIWDSVRGMVAGTDPSLLLNTTGAEVNANSVYTVTTGFQIVSTAAGINASGGTYIFLAIA